MVLLQQLSLLFIIVVIGE